MRLNSLRLINFRQHADTHIAFESGLTGIIGPNGSGKTTILEAITWALYGHARGTRESIRHHRAGPRAPVRVALDFELAGHRYRVDRGLSGAELYLDGASAPIANTITGVTQLLQRRLGMSRTEFFHTYFTGQKELGLMAAMTSSDRAKFLSRVLGYERLRTAQELARDRRKVVAAEMAGMRGGMADREAVARAAALAESRLADAAVRATAASAVLDGARAALAGVAPQWERVQRERERWTELSTGIKLSEGEVDRLEKDRRRVAGELDAVQVAGAELDGLRAELSGYAGLVHELQRQDALSRDDVKRRALTERDRELNQELAQLVERIGALASAPELAAAVEVELAARRLALDENQAKSEARRSEWVRQQQEARTKLQALKEQRDDLKKQRERLVAAGENGQCPTCARPLSGGHFTVVLDLLQEQSDTITVDGKYYQGRLKQLNATPEDLVALDERRKALVPEIAALERKLAKVQAGARELEGLRRDSGEKSARRLKVQTDLAAIPTGYDESRHGVVRAEVERMTPLEQRAARLAGVVDRYPALERERAHIAAAFTAAVAAVEDMRQRRAALGFDDATYGQIREEWERADAAARIAEIDGVRAGAEVDAARAALESAEGARRALERVQQKLDGLTVERRLHDEVDRAYSELRDELNVQLRPEVSELASGFLSELTDGRYTEIELDDQYNVLVREDGVPKPVISGGEEDVANLVLRLAVSQMIAERAGQSFSLLVLDEVFGSLDESRRRNVVDLLRRLHDRFDQVIVITHIDAVRDGLDRVMTVRYDEARATSVVDLPPGTAPVESDEPLALAV